MVQSHCSTILIGEIPLPKAGIGWIDLQETESSLATAQSMLAQTHGGPLDSAVFS